MTLDPSQPWKASTDSERALLACILEATARKPGNVHPEASFVDLAYRDFVQAAWLIAPSFHATERRVGAVVRDAIQRTSCGLGRNTNLGIVLLLAPLACVPRDVPLRSGIGHVLSTLDQKDAADVYAAIRLANPGGLGRVDREDISSVPSVTLLEAMRLAADRDRIATQYATNFETVFAGADRLARDRHFAKHWEKTVIDLHLWLMAEFPDTLIARKCGWETANEASRRARQALEQANAKPDSMRSQISSLDAWLRADGHRRNPGTTADLVAACLFAAFRDGQLDPPPVPECARPFLPG